MGQGMGQGDGTRDGTGERDRGIGLDYACLCATTRRACGRKV